MATTSAHKGGVCDLVYERGPVTSTLVSCGADGQIRVLTGESLKASTLESDEFSNSDPLRCIAFSPKDPSFVTGGDDSRVVLFVKDSTSQRFKFDALLTRLQGRVHDVAYSRNGAWVACAGENKAVKLVSLENRQRVILLKGHEGPVKAVAFSTASVDSKTSAADAEAAYVATVGTDMSLRIWHVNFGDGVAKCERTIFKAFAKSLVNSEDFGVRLQWHPTLPLLAVPGGTTDVRVLKADGSEAFILKGEHSDDINAVSWHPSGSHLVSCSPRDKKLAVWDTRNLEQSFKEDTLSTTSSQSFLKVHGEYASAAVCNVAWNPNASKSDELAFVDAGGMVQRLVVPILSKRGTKPISKTPVEATRSANGADAAEDDDDDDDDDLFKSRRSAKTPKKKSKKKGKKRTEKATTPAKAASTDDDDVAPIVTSTRKKRSRRASRRIDDSDNDSDGDGDATMAAVGDENDHLSANVGASARKKRKLTDESASDNKPDSSETDKKSKRSKMKLSSNMSTTLIETETETQSETQTVVITREETSSTEETSVKKVKSGKRLKKLKTTSSKMSLLDDSDSDVAMDNGDDSYLGDGIDSPTKHLASVKADKEPEAQEKPEKNRFDDLYSQDLSAEDFEALERKQVEEMEKAGKLPETMNSAAVYASGGKPKKKHRKMKSPGGKTSFGILDQPLEKLAAAGDSEERNEALMTQLGHGHGDNMEDVDDELMHSPSRRRKTSRRFAAPYLQPPLQVGSTPPSAMDDSQARFLAYNLVGRMTVRQDAPDFIAEIDFLDKAKNRAQRFKSEFEYALGALGQSGAVLACLREDNDAHGLDDDGRGRARIEYKPFHSWENLSGQWSYDLPKTEDIVSVALGLKFVAVATTLNTVRTFSFTGVQSMVFRVPGPLVAVHARDNFLATVYHRGAAAQPDHQNLGVKLFDMSRRTQLFDGELALSPGAELKWLDFNEHGILFAYDSHHQVSALFAHCGYMWMPVLDMKSLKRSTAANPVSVDVSEESVFPVGFHQGKLMCIITKGRRQYPAIGAPPQLTPIDLQVPLLGINDAPPKEAGSGNGSDDEDDDEDIMKADPSYLPRMEEDHLRSSLLWREACHHMNTRAPPMARARFFEKGGEETKMKKHMDQLRVAEFFSCSETDSTKALDLCQDIQMKGALKQCVMRANDLQNPQLAQRVNTLLKRKFSKSNPQTPAATTSSRGALNAPLSTSSSTSSLAQIRARRKERRESSDGRGRRQSLQQASHATKPTPSRVVSPPRSPSRSRSRSPLRQPAGYRSKKKIAVYSPNLSKNTPEFDRSESGNFKPLPRQDPLKFPPISIPASGADGDDDAAAAKRGIDAAARDIDADTPHPDIIDLEAPQKNNPSGFSKILGSNKKKQKAAARLPRHSPLKGAAKRHNPFERLGGNTKKTYSGSSSFSLD